MSETEAPAQLSERLARARMLAPQILAAIPQARALGLEVTRVEIGQVWGLAPYRAELVGDPATGVIAGGVLTTLLDSLCGMAVHTAVDALDGIATLDLRIDYMRPAAPGLAVQAMAHCYKLTRSIAFVRGIAYEREPEDPVAHSTGAFMINTGRKPGQNLPSGSRP
jgi:uncharacterized protein (TIGR00369 family)